MKKPYKLLVQLDEPHLARLDALVEQRQKLCVGPIATRAFVIRELIMLGERLIIASDCTYDSS